MDKPKGYDEAQAFTEFVKVPKGGYIGKIVKIEESKSNAGNDMIIAYLDIADGDFKDHYTNMYQSDTREQKRWGCTYYQLIHDTTTGNTGSGFKAFMTSVEESNSGFLAERCWGKDFTKFFRGKFIGIVMGEEFYYNNNNKLVSTTKPMRVCSVQSIKNGNFKIPDDKYPTGVTKPNNTPDFTPVPSEDDLPF